MTYCSTYPTRTTLGERYRRDRYLSGEQSTYSEVAIEIIEDAKFQEKYNYIFDLYNQERTLFKNLLDTLPLTDQKARNAINEISKWKFNNILLEITDEATIIFKLRVRESETLYLKIFLADEDFRNDSYFAYYDGDECQINGVGSFTQIISDLRLLGIN
jgi:hypothetical protein